MFFALVPQMCSIKKLYEKNMGWYWMSDPPKNNLEKYLARKVNVFDHFCFIWEEIEPKFLYDFEPKFRLKPKL